MAIETVDLTKEYERLTALDKLSLKVSLGAVLARLLPYSFASVRKGHDELSLGKGNLFDESLY
jgi:hypothetical protein